MTFSHPKAGGNIALQVPLLRKFEIVPAELGEQVVVHGALAEAADRRF